jgi:hypothetical protein
LCPTQNEAKITNDFKIGINTVKALRRRANAMMRISIVGLALLLAACDDEGSPAAPAASVSSWKIAYSPNMPASMSGGEGNWYFDFPSQNGVHYVYKLAPPIKVGQTITMHFAITGNGNFVPTEGTATARVRLFLQQSGDTLTAQEPYKRWWSLPYVELSDGEFTLSVPLSPDQWTSVFGQSGAEVPNEFNAAISKLKNVGFTFGGTFAGHGVFVTGGNARFVLKEFSVSP